MQPLTLAVHTYRTLTLAEAAQLVQTGLAGRILNLSLWPRSVALCGWLGSTIVRPPHGLGPLAHGVAESCQPNSLPGFSV